MCSQSVRPVALRSELLRQVLHLICQDTFFGKEVPFVGVGFEGHRQERHVCLFGALAVLEPVAAFAGGDDIFPLVGAPARDWQDMITGELTATELSAAV